MRFLIHLLAVGLVLLLCYTVSSQSVCKDPLRQSIWQTLDKDIQSGPWGCEKVLKTMPIDLRGTKAFIVRGYGAPFCGATGNCSTWVVARSQRTYRILLDAGSVIEHFDIHRRPSGQKSDFTFWGRMGAGDHYQGRYRFVGDKYRLLTCRYRVVDIYGKVTATKVWRHYCTT